MDKIRGGVVSDTAAVQGESGVPEIGGPDSGHANIDGHGLHVQTLASDSGGVRAQERIAPGRAVSADHVDFGIGFAQAGGEIVEQVEYSGIVVADVAGTVIPQIAVQAIERFGQVMAGFAINDIEAFAGVQVEEVEAVLGSGG